MGGDNHTRSIGVLERSQCLAIGTFHLLSSYERVFASPPSVEPPALVLPLPTSSLTPIHLSAHPHFHISSITPHTRSRRSSRDPKCPIGKAKPPGHPIIEIPHISPPFHCTWYPVHSGAIYIDITYFLTLYTAPVRCGISVCAAAVVDNVNAKPYPLEQT